MSAFQMAAPLEDFEIPANSFSRFQRWTAVVRDLLEDEPAEIRFDHGDEFVRWTRGKAWRRSDGTLVARPTSGVIEWGYYEPIGDRIVYGRSVAAQPFVAVPSRLAMTSIPLP